MRLPPDPANVTDGNLRAVGALFFADGSQKMLAAFCAWLAALALWEDHKDSLLVPEVQAMLASFLRVPTFSKGPLTTPTLWKQPLGEL